MIDARAEELINASIDEELTDAERIELDNILKESADARDYHAGLLKLDKMLKTMPQLDSPQTLRQGITASVELPGSGNVARLNPRTWPVAMRYGIAASLGLFFAIALLQFGNLTGQTGYEQMSGTILPGNHGQRQVIDQFSLTNDGIETSVIMAGNGGDIMLNVDIDSNAPVEIRVSPAPGLRFDAESSTISASDPSSNDESVIRLRSHGRQRFELMFHRLDAKFEAEKTDTIQIDFVRDGAVINTRVLNKAAH